MNFTFLNSQKPGISIYASGIRIICLDIKDSKPNVTRATEGRAFRLFMSAVC